MDKEKIDQALRDFATSLPEIPRWVALIKQDGSLLSKIDEPIDRRSTFLSDTDIVHLTNSLGLHEIEALDALKHGNLQYSIHIGGKGLYFIVNLIDTYWLGISYQTVGVQSLDRVTQAILINFQSILEAIYNY